jgi:hypothetical protein
MRVIWEEDQLDASMDNIVVRMVFDMRNDFVICQHPKIDNLDESSYSNSTKGVLPVPDLMIR